MIYINFGGLLSALSAEIIKHEIINFDNLMLNGMFNLVEANLIWPLLSGMVETCGHGH